MPALRRSGTSHTVSLVDRTGQKTLTKTSQEGVLGSAVYGLGARRGLGGLGAWRGLGVMGSPVHWKSLQVYPP